MKIGKRLYWKINKQIWSIYHKVRGVACFSGLKTPTEWAPHRIVSCLGINSYRHTQTL